MELILNNLNDFNFANFQNNERDSSLQQRIVSFVYPIQYKKNSKNIIIISEKKNNLLYSLCQNLNLYYIEHKHYIGGRYSVLSEVGMLPTELMGLNTNNFKQLNVLINISISPMQLNADNGISVFHLKLSRPAAPPP